MARQISRAESWSSVYKAFQNINFSAYDYETVKESLISYIKLYHSENFNDYIETSEIIAQIEAFAYVAEILAYRQDMNSHENFFHLAERKDSILQLAKYISYNASRNLPPRGLVKITSVRTTEGLSDSKGNSLTNKKISWNDTNNSDWKEQFFLIMNRAMQQPYGTVAPADRVQVDDVLFELYRLSNRPLANGVFAYNASGNGESFPMELVPVSLDVNGPYERRPDTTSPFSVVYGSDGLGDGSDTTGFFCFTKQGTLNRIRRTFDGITPNQTSRIGSTGINETDVWVNNVDPDSGQTFSSEIVDELGRRLGPSGEWVQVDIANVQNVIFNTNLNRNKFEIETLDEDDVRLIFGDGEFADIPSGAFDIWYRTSTAGSSVILQNSVINQNASFSYVDNEGKAQTFTFTFSLINSLVNGAAAEDIERIRRFAPSIYYTQDRMVNGRDYNNYPLQDQSIAKLRTVNRTFSGDSKYNSWHDASEHYEDVKIFGDDLTLFYKTINDSSTISNVQPLSLVQDTVQKLLTRIGVYLYHTTQSLNVPNREFTTTELGTLDITSDNTILGEIQKGLVNSSGDFNLYLVYRPFYNASAMPLTYQWVTYNNDDVSMDPNIAEEATFTLTYYRAESKWTVKFKSTSIVVYSPTTKFWFNNGANKTLVEDTLNAQLDNVVILAANINSANNLLGTNLKLNSIGTSSEDWLDDVGDTSEHTLSVISRDTDADGIPDNMDLPSLVRNNTTTVVTKPDVMPANFTVAITDTNVICGLNELIVDVNGKRFVSRQSGNYGSVNASQALYYFDEMSSSTAVATPGQVVKFIKFSFVNQTGTTEVEGDYNVFINRGGSYNVTVHRTHYAYFTRASAELSVWTAVTQDNLEATKIQWLDTTKRNNIMRYVGRNGLNFAWFHRTPRYYLIDPAPTNIMDMYIITRGYYEQVRAWLRGDAAKPTPPTSLALRTSYEEVLEGRMMSDTVVTHPGKFRVIFGSQAETALQCVFRVIKATGGRLTDNELKVRIIGVIRNYFDIDQWEFGETFYATELIAAIHANLPGEIDSIVIVPTSDTNYFGELFEIVPREDEMFQPSIDVDDIEIVSHYTSKTLKQK